MIIKEKFYKIIVILFIISSCSTLKERYNSEVTYKIFKDSKKPESILKIKRDRNEKIWGELSSQLISPAVIIGDIIEDQTGDINFVINSIKYFSNWANGWTQGESKASGEIIFTKEENIWKAFIKEEIEIEEVIKGDIRYYDDYYRKESGLKKVGDRMKRIIEVINFLKKQEFVDFPDFFGHVRFNSRYGKPFKKETQGFLFPESIDIDKLKRKNQFPVDYNIPVNQKNDLAFSSGFFWRRSYTEKYFPDYLRELRNSGTLWRDYEEAVHLFYMLYNMDYYFNYILNNAYFIKF